MRTNIINKSHGFYIAGKVLTTISYITGIIALATYATIFFAMSAIWSTIPEIVNEIPTEYQGYVTAGCLVIGNIILILMIAFIIVGAINLKRITAAKTKNELLPWAIVTTIIFGTLGGIFLLLSSLLPIAHTKAVDVEE